MIVRTKHQKKGNDMTNKNEIPKKCPSCGSNMRVHLMKCSSCDTEIQGDFEPGRFSSLTDEQLDFLEIFVKSRGSLKDVGKLLDISYPTARNRLNDLVQAFESINHQEASYKRIDILEQVKSGDLTVEEALDKLK